MGLLLALLCLADFFSGISGSKDEGATKADGPDGPALGVHFWARDPPLELTVNDDAGLLLLLSFRLIWGFFRFPVFSPGARGERTA